MKNSGVFEPFWVEKEVVLYVSGEGIYKVWSVICCHCFCFGWKRQVWNKARAYDWILLRHMEANPNERKKINSVHYTNSVHYIQKPCTT